MKRHTQTSGIRHYYGDDLIELQNEPLKAIDAIFQQYGQCVVQGCEVIATGNGLYNISRGVVALAATDTPVIVMPFDGATAVTLPVYLVSFCQLRTRVYDDGNVKPIAYDYSARLVSIRPSDVPYLEIKSSGAPLFIDVLQNATHRFISDLERKKWDNTSSTTATQGTSGLMSATDKLKLDGIATKANNYTHPNDSSTRHVSDTEKQTWNNKASTTAATDRNSGLMSAADKVKIDGIAEGANKYVHPDDAANKHINILEKAKIARIDDKLQIRVAGHIELPYTSGVIPADKIHMYKGSCTAEVLEVGGTGINVYYRIYHNLKTTSYFPIINLFLDSPILLSVVIKDIKDNYFEVILSAQTSAGAAHATGYYCPFCFYIHEF